MVYNKLFLIAVLGLVLIPCASASWFNESAAPVMGDVEQGTKELVLSIVAICVVASIAATLYGWFGHNRSYLKIGVGGFGIIIFVAIAYAIATGVFDYFVGRYW